MLTNIKLLVGTFLLAVTFTWWGVKQFIEAYEDNGPMDFATDAIAPGIASWLVFIAIVIKTRRDAVRSRAGRHWHDKPGE